MATGAPTTTERPIITVRRPRKGQCGLRSSSSITAAGVIATYVNGSEGQKLVSAAGGTLPYTAQLINTYNQDYPNYPAPEVDVEVNGTDVGAVMRTYAAVIQVIKAQNVARQVAAKSQKVDWMTLKVIGGNGPLAQPGSSKRTLGGLMVLTLVGIFAVAIFFDRHPIRLGELTRSRRGAGRPAVPAVGRGTSRT